MSFQLFRRVFYELHLWLGVLSGIIVVLVCLSGTILVFQEEAAYLAEPQRYRVAAEEGQNAIEVDELIAKVEAAKPGKKVASITVPENSKRTVTMNLAASKPPQSEHGERGARGRNGGGRGARGQDQVQVNPYTGEIVGEGPSPVAPFFQSMMKLHRWFWFSGEWQIVGKMIVGWATVIFVVLCLSGLVLWLPKTWTAFKRRSSWKNGFRIRFKKGLWPFLYDLHNTVGFYLLVPAVILALTGLCWSFQWYRNGASDLLGDEIFKQRRWRPTTIEEVDATAQPLSVGEMIAKQNELTPGPGEISVTIPQDHVTAMVIQKGRTGFFSLAMKDRTQWDRFRGEVVPVEHYGKTVQTERFADKPLGAKIAASIRGLHLGNITGTSSKIFFFIVCLFATSWPITGVALWIKKLRTKAHARKMIAAQKANAAEEAANRARGGLD